MKKILTYNILAVLLVCGCQVKETIDITRDSQPEAKVFTAIIEDNTSGGTKTSLDDSGNVLWKMGDQVSIFSASTVNEQYQVSDDSDGKTSATLNKVGGSGYVAGTEIDNNVAFYPYAASASIAKSGTSYIISDIALPATQNYVAASFGNGAFPMAAVTSSTTDMNLKFKNVLGGLKLQLKGTATITSISVTGKNNEKLYGAAEVTLSNGSTPSISLSDASAKTVTLDCGAGVALNSETATPFIIALPPITMTGGFTVIVTDTDGKQMEISTTKSQTIPRSSLLKMPAVNYVGKSVVNYAAEPITFLSTGSTSVRIKKNNYSAADAITIEYRMNSGQWLAYSLDTYINLADGESMQFRAGSGGNDSMSENNMNNGNNYYFQTTGEGTIEVYGNIMSLLDQSLQRSSLSQYSFECLFAYDCNNITNASNLVLPATSLAEECYCGMFESCTNLISAPQLPATTLANQCYSNMFKGCSSLSTAPELPATTLAYHCYSQMFSGCTNLSTAPELPATTLAEGCYMNMFGDSFGSCTSLTTAPELPATALAFDCYSGMFRGCTGLTTAPELPAPTLVNGCYFSMFYGCTSLNYIKMLATDVSPSTCLRFWVTNVAASGTFIKNASATWDITGDNGVPSGWTVQTE